MKKMIVIFLILIAFVLAGCNSNKEDKKVVVALQYGLAYAPVQVMRVNGILENRLADYEVVYKELANTQAIREALISSGIDIGFMGIPPFIIGVDQGIDWKIISGLNESPLGLVVNDDDIQSLDDFSISKKLALPQLGSIQHILLSMSLLKEYDDSKMLDSSISPMSHPDAYQALISKKGISGHFTSPPYLFKERDNGGRLLLTGEEAFGGEFTFIASVCTDDFHKDKKAYNAFKDALDESIEFINTKREETIDILMPIYDIEEEELEQFLYEEGMVYTRELKGIESFVDFMENQKYIKKKYEMGDLIWDE